MQQTPVMQRVPNDAEHEHSHGAVVHTSVLPPGRIQKTQPSSFFQCPESLT